MKLSRVTKTASPFILTVTQLYTCGCSCDTHCLYILDSYFYTVIHYFCCILTAATRKFHSSSHTWQYIFLLLDDPRLWGGVTNNDRLTRSEWSCPHNVQSAKIRTKQLLTPAFKIIIQQIRMCFIFLDMDNSISCLSSVSSSLIVGIFMVL